MTLAVRCSEIDIVVFSLNGCSACVRLKQMFASVLANSSDTRFKEKLRFHEVVHGEKHDFFPAQEVQPRMFPTVIAYCNELPVLGWEGFALLEPNEIQESLVTEVLEQAVEYVS